MDAEARAARLRRTAYMLMTVAAVAAVSGRILSVERVYEPSLHRPEPAFEAAAVTVPLAATGPIDLAVLAAGAAPAWERIDPDAPPRVWPRSRPKPMPTFSSNDRSRWATVRALVDEGTFAVGRREFSGIKFRDVGIITEDGWQTVDKVLHPQTHVFYSSKPPLLSTILAGEYWLIQKLTGWTLADQPWKVICTILLTVNVLPLILYLTMLARLLEWYGTTDWGRLFTFAAACFGTFINTFSISLNNHTLAAFTTLFAVYPLLRPAGAIAVPTSRDMAVCGLFAGLTFCLELPAAVLLAGLAVGCFWLSPGRALLAFVPAAALPIAAQLGTNYAALGDVWPAYAKTDTDWYKYAGSHWAKKGADRRGVDFAGDQETRQDYAFHFLAGHHGVFSLTPVWLLAVFGLGLGRNSPVRWRQVMWLTLIVSVVVIIFFAAIVDTVNYGGWSSGPRWLFWLSPLWLLAVAPAADRLSACALGRGFAYACLAWSVLSASYPAWNPWRHPWIFQVLEAWKLAGYG